MLNEELKNTPGNKNQQYRRACIFYLAVFAKEIKKFDSGLKMPYIVNIMKMFYRKQELFLCLK